MDGNTELVPGSWSWITGRALATGLSAERSWSSLDLVRKDHGHVRDLSLDRLMLISEDRFPPSEVANKEMVVKEGERQKITTDFLSFTDVDSEPGSLLYQVFEGPDLGHLELTKDPGSLTEVN